MQVNTFFFKFHTHGKLLGNTLEDKRFSIGACKCASSTRKWSNEMKSNTNKRCLI